ncbi:MAG: hypothetical protein ACI4VQ_06215 [Clostridia bacterium]
MDSYKIEYNNLLKRYYNGCDFLKENPDEINKYLSLLLNILDKLNIIIEKYKITDSNIILNGF